MAAITQHRPHGALAGVPYGTLSGKTAAVVVDEIESRPHKGRKGEKEPRVLEEEYELFYLIMAIAAGSSEFLH